MTNNVTQKDLEYTRTTVIQHVESLLDDLQDLLSIISKSIEALEKQMATISVGYVEQASILEALVNSLPEEKHEDFKKYLAASREKMMKAMKEGQDVLSGDG